MSTELEWTEGKGLLGEPLWWAKSGEWEMFISPTGYCSYVWAAVRNLPDGISGVDGVSDTLDEAKSACAVFL